MIRTNVFFLNFSFLCLRLEQLSCHRYEMGFYFKNAVFWLIIVFLRSGLRDRSLSDNQVPSDKRYVGLGKKSCARSPSFIYSIKDGLSLALNLRKDMKRRGIYL